MQNLSLILQEIPSCFLFIPRSAFNIRLVFFCLSSGVVHDHILLVVKGEENSIGWIYQQRLLFLFWDLQLLVRSLFPESLHAYITDRHGQKHEVESSFNEVSRLQRFPRSVNSSSSLMKLTVRKTHLAALPLHIGPPDPPPSGGSPTPTLPTLKHTHFYVYTHKYHSDAAQIL